MARTRRAAASGRTLRFALASEAADAALQAMGSVSQEVERAPIIASRTSEPLMDDHVPAGAGSRSADAAPPAAEDVTALTVAPATAAAPALTVEIHTEAAAPVVPPTIVAAPNLPTVAPALNVPTVAPAPNVSILPPTTRGAPASNVEMSTDTAAPIVATTVSAPCIVSDAAVPAVAVAVRPPFGAVLSSIAASMASDVPGRMPRAAAQLVMATPPVASGGPLEPPHVATAPLLETARIAAPPVVVAPASSEPLPRFNMPPASALSTPHEPAPAPLPIAAPPPDVAASLPVLPVLPDDVTVTTPVGARPSVDVDAPLPGVPVPPPDAVQPPIAAAIPVLEGPPPMVDAPRPPGATPPPTVAASPDDGAGSTPTNELAITLTGDEELLSLVARSIFIVSPAVVHTNLAIPALFIVYFVSRMPFLSCADPVYSATAVHNTLYSLLKVPKIGWPVLSRCFGLPPLGLYLGGRTKKRASQLCGQPRSIPSSLFDTMNPDGGQQWVSRRLRLRETLNLHVAAGTPTRPGDLTARELNNLVALLTSDHGRSLAYALGCRVRPGFDSDGQYTPVAVLEFDWSKPWESGTPTASLIDKLSANLLKAPHCYLAKVSSFPVDLEEQTARPLHTPGVLETAQGPSLGKRGRKAVPQNAARRSAVARRAQPRVEETPSFVPGLPSVLGPDLLGQVRPCSLWPDGAWAMQMPLWGSLDTLAQGRPVLDIRVAGSEFPVPDADGNYGYSVQVTQLPKSIETPLSKKLAEGITAPPELGHHSRSVDFLQWIRSMALDCSERRSATTGTRRDEDRSDDSDGDYQLAADDVRVDITSSGPAPELFKHRVSFLSPLRLLVDDAVCRREPGRLFVLVPAARKLARMSLQV